MPKPAMEMPRCPDPWRQQRADPARGRGDHVEPHGHEIGAENRRDADHHEQHGQIEGEGREFAALGEAGDPAVERGPPADRVLPDVGQEGGGARLRNLDVPIGQHVERVAVHFSRDFLSLMETALSNEPHGGLWQVMAENEDHQRRHGAEPERQAPDQFVIHVDGEENGDDRERQNLADGEHELPAVAHHVAAALAIASMM